MVIKVIYSDHGGVWRIATYGNNCSQVPRPSCVPSELGNLTLTSVTSPRMVLTIAKATVPPSPSAEMLAWQIRVGRKPKSETWDPPLKARNPKTRMKPPSPARGTEWPGISTGFPSVNLQMVMVMVTEWPLAIDVHCPSGDKDIEVDKRPLVR